MDYLWVPPKPAIIRPAEKELIAPILGITMLARTSLCRRGAAAAAAGGDVPTFFAAGTASNDMGGGTSVTPSYPASVSADDVAIMIHVSIDFGASGGFSLSTPSGWTAVGAQVVEGSVLYARAYWKRLAGSESGTVTVSHSAGFFQAYARIGVYRGCTTIGDPFEDYDSTSGFGDTITSPSTTTTAANRMGLRLSCVVSGSATSPPSGWTEDYETAVNALNIAGDRKTIASASTESASARTASLETQYIVLAMALKPT